MTWRLMLEWALESVVDALVIPIPEIPMVPAIAEPVLGNVKKYIIVIPKEIQ